MTTFKRTVPNIAGSVFRFVKDTPYTVDAVTGSLIVHFPTVAIVHAFPDDLTKLTLPTLAITAPLHVETVDPFLYGESGQTQEFELDIYGFVVGQGKVNQSQLYRDRLMSDLHSLFDVIGRTEGIPLFDQVSKAEIGQIETVRARALVVPAISPEIEAERYRFKLELAVGYDLEWA